MATESGEETAEKDEITRYDHEKLRQVLIPNRAKNADPVKEEELGDILLTGAAGFLGIHVLKAFLDSHKGKVYALVRKGSYESSQKRLMNMLRPVLFKSFAFIFQYQNILFQIFILGLR